jgi:uncharacterized cupredoxin-like copper-binding protein
MRKVLLAPLALAGVLLLAGCGGGAVDDRPADIEVTMTGLAFGPAHLTLKAGQPVTIGVRNTSMQFHDFAVPDMPAADIRTGATAETDEHAAHDGGDRVHVAVIGKSRATITFTPTQPGTYTFLCTVPGHAESGMQGTITVE